MTSTERREPIQHVTIERSASEADAAEVRRGLLYFNERLLGPARTEELRVIARSHDGRIVGGLLGVTRWQWLYIAKLWVAEESRGQRVGSALMDAAESLARQRGCSNAFVDTFAFQARPFYEKRGYVVFGALEGYPPGYRQYHLAKHLR